MSHTWPDQVAHALVRAVSRIVSTRRPRALILLAPPRGPPPRGGAVPVPAPPRWPGALILLAAACIASAQPGQPAPAQPSYSMQDSNLRPALPGALQGVGIDQKLDTQVPLNLTFRDEAGRTVPLSTYFQGKKPVILALVYYECPMLCTQILNDLESSLKAVSFNPGQDFEVVSVSFDPKDTPEIAASKKQSLLKRYGRPNTANGWHFLVGDQPNIKKIGRASCR